MPDDNQVSKNGVVMFRPVHLGILAASSLSVLILWVALLIYIDKQAHASLADVGALISSVASTIAFVWLLFGYWMQYKVLITQQRQLNIQLDELRLQSDALQKAGRAADLDAFLRLLDNTRSSLRYDVHKMVVYYNKFLNKAHVSPKAISSANLEEDIMYLTSRLNIINFIKQPFLSRSELPLSEFFLVYCQKYEALDNALRTLSGYDHLYRSLLTSSPMAQLYYIIKKALSELPHLTMIDSDET